MAHYLEVFQLRGREGPCQRVIGFFRDWGVVCRYNTNIERTFNPIRATFGDRGSSYWGYNYKYG